MATFPFPRALTLNGSGSRGLLLPPFELHGFSFSLLPLLRLFFETLSSISRHRGRKDAAERAIVHSGGGGNGALRRSIEAGSQEEEPRRPVGQRVGSSGCGCHRREVLSFQVGYRLGIRSLRIQFCNVADAAIGEDMLKALKEKPNENEPEEQKPELVTEMLFLCTYDGCGKTFAEARAFRKHTHIHGERQYICPVEGCGKKFLDSSKLKRHNVIHTGERNHKCPYEGCGKAFSLDFNLRAHMKTHSLENYHFCPYPECGKKYTHECKLKTHIKTHHDKVVMMDKMPPPEKVHSARKLPVITSASLDRPYVCPYAGCGKAYIHEYKLNLHLRKEHTSHNPVESYKAAFAVEHRLHEGNDQGSQNVKIGVAKKKSGKANVSRKMPPVKVANGKACPTPEVANDGQKKRPSKELLDEDCGN